MSGNGPHGLIDLNSWSFRELCCLRGTKRCGIVEGNASLQMGFEVSKAKAQPSVFLFLLPANPNLEQNSQLLQHHVFVHATRLPACHDDNGLKLQNCKQSPVKCCPSCELWWPWCLFTAIEHWLRQVLFVLWPAISSLCGMHRCFFTSPQE